MKRYYFLVILFALAFLQTTIIPLNLLLLMLAALAFCRTLRELLIFAFSSGLLLDFLSGMTFGLGSFFFLVFVTVLYSSRQKFIHTTYRPDLKTVAPLLFFSVFLGEILWQVFFAYFTGQSLTFPWIQIFVGIFISFVFFPTVSWLSLRWQETEQLGLQF
jgi:hypothetical protein